MFKSKLKLLIGLTVLCAIASGGYFLSTRNSTASVQVAEYKEVTARQGDIKINFLADGKAYLPVLKLRFPISGQLKDVMFDTGDKVKKGDLIAKLEDKEYINKIESARINQDQAVVKLEKTKQQYESQLASEKSKLDNLKYQLDNIALQYQPMQQIPETYSEQEIKLKKVAFESAKAAYESALEAYNLLLKGTQDITLDEINIRQTKISVKVAEDGLSDTILKSPVDGEVLSISHRPGETVSNSTDFAVISDIGRLSVIAQVSELDVPKIEKGQSVEMEFEALQGQSFKGGVLSVDPLPVTDSGGIVNYTVNIEIDNTTDTIKDGMTCSVSFILKQKQNVVVIPNTAVKRVEGKQVVEIKDEIGNIVTKNIKTGLTDGTNVEVTEGLNAGDILIIRAKK